MQIPCFFLPKFVHWPIWADDALTVLVALGALLVVFREIWRLLRPYRKAKYGIERLGYHFRTKNSVHIFGLYDELPIIRVRGRFKLSHQAEKALSVLPVPEENDPHAIIVGEPDWKESKLYFEVQGLDYHQLKAIRQSGERPHVLSANAVIVCRQRRELILHTRARLEAATYPGCYHTFGGGYMPPGVQPKDDGDSLVNTLTREVDEESKIKLVVEKLPRLLILQEVLTGFVQVAFLGINISAKQAEHLPADPKPVEGRPFRVKFDDLEGILASPNWVPTGKAVVLAWLALGAPGAGPYAKFGKDSAAALCERILSTVHTEYSGSVHQVTGR